MAMKVAPRKQRIAYMKKDMIVTKPVYYPTVDKDELLEAASRNNNIKPSTIQVAIDAVLNEFQNFLFKGHPVTLPGLGTFKVRIQAHAVDVEDLKNAGVAAVYNRSITYRIDRKLKQACKDMELSVLQKDILTEIDNEENPEQNTEP